MKELEAKNIVVVGASKGLGKALVEQATERNANVFALSRNIGDADLPESTKRIVCDATNPKQVLIAFSEITAEKQKLDVVVSALGLGLVKSFAETTDEEIEEMLNVNLKAPLFVASRAFDYMKDNGGGHIVTVSSTTGLEGKANEVVYSAAKQGLRGMNQALAKEGEQYGIKATCVFPGGMDNPNFWEHAKPDLDTSKFMSAPRVAIHVIDMLETGDHPLEFVIRRPAI